MSRHSCSVQTTEKPKKISQNIFQNNILIKNPAEKWPRLFGQNEKISIYICSSGRLESSSDQYQNSYKNKNNNNIQCDVRGR